MQALKEPNVNVHFTAVQKLTPDGIAGADGRTLSNIDTIVMATGFDTSYRPHFPVIGQKGVSLADKFTPRPDSYFGLSAPGKLPSLLLLFVQGRSVLTDHSQGSLTTSVSFDAECSLPTGDIQAEDFNLRAFQLISFSSQ